MNKPFVPERSNVDARYSPKVNEDVVVTATATQLNHTVGVTSAIQTQLDAKAAKSFAIAQAVALG